MSEEQVVTLLVQEGNKGDPIGSYGSARYRKGSIVFLHDEAKERMGQEVRVRLEEIRPDSRGVMMYRGLPAGVEYSERWKDNGDGTASKLIIQTEWLGNETVWDESEPKKLKTREGTASSRAERSVVWGSSLTDSYVEEVEIRTIPIESEVVKNGALVWEKTDEREEQSQPVQLPVTRSWVETLSCEWHSKRLHTIYESAWKLIPWVYFQTDGEESHLKLETTWGDIPTWLQEEFSSRYPVCSCGRQRRDAQVADGYAKCELCRGEEICERCGKQAKVTVINGRLVCDVCQPYEAAEQLIVSHLMVAHRQAIADEAKRLLAGQALEGELGLTVLKAGLGHISSDYIRGRILNRWERYRWYYFTDEGVFGTKFDPAALQVLGHLAQATGNSLVELVAWFDRGPRATLNSGYRDFYLRTQVQGEILASGPIEDIVQRLVDGSLGLADRLRGSEAERQEALALWRKAQKEIADASYSSSVGKLYYEARDLLGAEEQDYGSVISVLRRAFAVRESQKALQDLLAEEYSRCPVCGSETDFSDYHYCGHEHQDTLKARGQWQDFVVKVSVVGQGQLVELKAVYEDRYDEYELVMKVFHENAGEISDPTEVETLTFWRVPSERERELAEQLAQVQNQLDQIQYERNIGGRAEGTFRAVEHRDKAQLQFEGNFTGTVDNRSADEGYSSYEDQPALFVCREHCPWLDEQPEAGQRWLCTTAFQIGVTGGKPIIVVNPQACSDLEDGLKQQLARLQQELAAEQGKAEPFDENGEANTAMAVALQQAGLM